MTSNDYARVERAIRYLERHFRDQPGLGEVAAGAGMSEQHFQRVFRRWAGISPKRFLQQLTSQFTGALLRDAAPSLEAAYAAGLSGPGRLHDLYVAMHAVTPAQYREHGAGLTIRHGFCESPFGTCLVGLTDRGVCWLSFVGERGDAAALGELTEHWSGARHLERPDEVARVGRRIFEDAAGSSERVLLDVRGTNFQIRVWQALLSIPAGTVSSYGSIAGRLGAPNASRAVGVAVGANPVAYLIPCHRVIRSTGAVGEYRWGAPRKHAMLAWEAARLGPDP